MAKKKTTEALMSFEKWVQVESVDMHPYTQAYIGADFRGIMKTKEGWAAEVSKRLKKE